MDKIPLNAHQLFAFVLPGLTFSFPTFYSFYFAYIEPGSLDSFCKHYKDNEVLISFILIISGLLSGLVLDSLRVGILEMIFDKFKKINWEFFRGEDEKKVKMLYERYYNFYAFNINTISACILSWSILCIYVGFKNIIPISIFEIIVIGVLIRESYVLRGDIVEITEPNHQ